MSVLHLTLFKTTEREHDVIILIAGKRRYREEGTVSIVRQLGSQMPLEEIGMDNHGGLYDMQIL